MDIGTMRHRISIHSQNKTTNLNGFEQIELVELFSTWAFVQNLYGKEYFEAAVIKKQSMVKFTFRYKPGLDESMKIKFEDRIFDIEAIDNIRYENIALEIKAMEVDASG